MTDTTFPSPAAPDGGGGRVEIVQAMHDGATALEYVAEYVEQDHEASVAKREAASLLRNVTMPSAPLYPAEDPQSERERWCLVGTKGSNAIACDCGSCSLRSIIKYAAEHCWPKKYLTAARAYVVSLRQDRARLERELEEYHRDEQQRRRRVTLATAEGALAAALGQPLSDVAKSRYEPRTLEGDAWEHAWQFVAESAEFTATRERTAPLEAALDPERLERIANDCRDQVYRRPKGDEEGERFSRHAEYLRALSALTPPPKAEG